MHKKEPIQHCVNKSFSRNETTALTVEDGLCEYVFNVYNLNEKLIVL